MTMKKGSLVTTENNEKGEIVAEGSDPSNNLMFGVKTQDNPRVWELFWYYPDQLEERNKKND